MCMVGLSSVADKLEEFSLAWKDENSDDWIDGNLYKHTHYHTCERSYFMSS